MRITLDPDNLDPVERAAWQRLAARHRPKPRRWATPGAMAQELDRSTRQTPLLDLIDEVLVRVAASASDKAMIFTPPQEGKSSRVARRFPLWLLQHDPKLRVVIVSYDQEHATRWGRDIRRDVQENPELGIQLRPDSKAAGRWHTQEGGSVYCTGIHGAFTGQPADVLLIDDPVKDRRTAESKAEREATWDWWENVAKVRARRVVLIMTRWHTDDLAGRLLANEPGEWSMLSVPAIAGEPVQIPTTDGGTSTEWRPSAKPDPLGRAPGEELRSVQGPEARPPGYFRRLFERLSGYVWRALFQQAPTAARGSMFLRDRWRYWEPGGEQRVNLDGRVIDLRDCWRFLTVDLAASKRTSADWTVAAAWAMTGDRDLLLLGRVRERTAEADHWALVAPLAERWSTVEVGVEPTMMGTTLVRSAAAAGLQPFDTRADGDKITRAIPYAHLVKARRVWLPAAAAWLDEWIGEHADFPTGSHDDQVDVGAYAARLVVAEWNPVTDTAGQVNGYRAGGRDREIDWDAVPM